jgi:hypothetical protein
MSGRSYLLFGDIEGKLDVLRSHRGAVLPHGSAWCRDSIVGRSRAPLRPARGLDAIGRLAMVKNLYYRGRKCRDVWADDGIKAMKWPD